MPEASVGSYSQRAIMKSDQTQSTQFHPESKVLSGEPGDVIIGNRHGRAYEDGVLDGAIARARRRLVPFLLLMYIISFLDRANIGFAKQALETQAGISPRAYALAAGLFFLTYAAFELPSNLILHRVGAKVWMARIMVTWGLVSMATMFVVGSRSFYALRLLLGAAEAGFFPGVILYLTYWFPNRARAQIFGLFYFGAPLAFIFGAPVSGLLLQMYPVGSLQNWQWMFLVEGSLAVAVGIWSYWYLDNRPVDAGWLTRQERNTLTKALSTESQQHSHSPASLLPMLRDPHLLHFVLIYFLLQMSVYGVVFYLPSEVAALIHKPAGFEVGLVSALPWICALAGAFWIPRVADVLKQRRHVAAATLAIAACASFLFPLAGPRTGLLALSVAATGLIAVQPLFWTFPTNYLSDRAAAGGLAIINALGALGGFVAPNVKVWADEHFGSAEAGLYLLAAVTILNAALIAFIGTREPSASKVP
jgi:MFS transporter, ACS family, inner membrane transport protein